MLEEREEGNYIFILLVSLYQYIVRVPSISITLQPLLEDTVNRGVVVDEKWIIWRGSNISHHTFYVIGKTRFQIHCANNDMDLQKLAIASNCVTILS